MNQKELDKQIRSLRNEFSEKYDELHKDYLELRIEFYNFYTEIEKLANNRLEETSEIKNLLDELEIKFKTNLDKYKYPSRFSEIDPHFHRDKNLCFLEKLNSYLKNNKSLNCEHLTFLDYAVFPFIRQFRNVDQEWFDKLNFKLLNNWLNQIIDSEDFSSIMKKFKKWEPNDLPIYTNFE